MTLLKNIDTKSHLAKLLATENIQVEQNNVQTASFDVKNRILTLPIFKHENKDVIDMLIAHECAHALWTDEGDWMSISSESNEFRAYCNVLEDTRIDRLIQKKYPGVTKNYIKGYKELIKIDFFGVNSRDLNTLNLIDKINLYYKSSKSENIDWTDNEWILDRVDNLKSFDDVKEFAKELIESEKGKKQESKNTDNHNQENDDDDSREYDGGSDDTIAEGQNENEESDDNADDISEEETEEESADENQNNGESGSDNSNQNADDPDINENDVPMPETLDNENISKQKLAYSGDKLFKYFTLPDVNLKNAIITNDTFRKDMRHTFRKMTTGDTSYYREQYATYYNVLKTDFKKFKNDNQKVVNYLVKEFEMKKSADQYKRSSTNKTGVLDPIKLKNYKYSEDLFKKLTVLPDAKNHGFIFLLDWSGSMFDCIRQTVEQLSNLIWFAKKINVPFEVYSFTDVKIGDDLTHIFKMKSGDIELDGCKLVNLASHKNKSREIDESLMYLFHMVNYYDESYGYSRRRRYYRDDDVKKGMNPGFKQKYGMGSTPLNESLVILNKLIPLFKNKYQIQKLSLITLTDGHSNRSWGNVHGREYVKRENHQHVHPVIKDKNKMYSVTKDKTDNIYYSRKTFQSRDYTNLMISFLKKKYSIKVVGFHVIKSHRDGNIQTYIKDDLPYNLKSEKTSDLTKKGFITAELTHGYDNFWILNKKKMTVENSKIDEISPDMKTSQIKRLFAGGMKKRLNSRILLNKFIENVA